MTKIREPGEEPRSKPKTQSAPPDPAFTSWLVEPLRSSRPPGARESAAPPATSGADTSSTSAHDAALLRGDLAALRSAAASTAAPDPASDAEADGAPSASDATSAADASSAADDASPDADDVQRPEDAVASVPDAAGTDPATTDASGVVATRHDGEALDDNAGSTHDEGTQDAPRPEDGVGQAHAEALGAGSALADKGVAAADDDDAPEAGEAPRETLDPTQSLTPQILAPFDGDRPSAEELASIGLGPVDDARKARRQRQALTVALLLLLLAVGGRLLRREPRIPPELATTPPAEPAVIQLATGEPGSPEAQPSAEGEQPADSKGKKRGRHSIAAETEPAEISEPTRRGGPSVGRLPDLPRDQLQRLAREAEQRGAPPPAVEQQAP